MEKFIHHGNWNSLDRQQFTHLFAETFDNVTVLPNRVITLDLRTLSTATLECLENRSVSTVYRILPTGVVYQIIKPDVTIKYDDYEEYLLSEITDELKVAYPAGT